MATSTPTPSAVPSLANSVSVNSPMSSSPQTPAPEGNDMDSPEGADYVDPEDKIRAEKLKFLLDKSQIYARIIGERMERQQKQQAEAAARKAKKKREAGRDISTPPSKKQKGDTSRPTRSSKSGAPPDEVDPSPVAEEESYTFQQPALVTGAKLRGYQLAGVQWCISLYENGLNGILADEMGLGKTLQTISFFAHLRSKGTWGPFLVVCPLSVLHNWVSEFEKFAPSIPVVMYHGSQEHRAELRATRLQAPANSGVGNIRNVKGKGKGRPRSSVGITYSKQSNTTETFPIIITTFEICMRDQPFLSGYEWKFIVVDEGHRLKNLDCKLIRELKSYKSANRMILTGTPLHNNLSELWSLLNFILPDIFDNLDAFQQWFNFDEMEQGGAASLINKGSVVQSLHAILKPFLLRRLKVEVEDLPPKKEYLLYAPLTQQQKDMYEAILQRDIRRYLIEQKTGRIQEAEAETSTPDGRGRRAKTAINYTIEESDSKWLKDLEKPLPIKIKTPQDMKDSQTSKATKEVNNLRLQNVAMQLRKVSSHPFLFDWPIDPKTNDLVVNTDLVEASGKMLLLNRLLDALFAKGHKVLIFSQFTTMLDVIQDWATLYKKFNTCRIDGTTTQESRRDQMKLFNESKGPNAPNLFLLSTRAGGLGINLVAADTVIFFDQDWNPQMDLQAQDRAHRIGQTKPVLVFRLVSQHTIETKILLKAGNKRRLEALVIKQGKFGKVVDERGRVLLGKKGESTVDMARALLELESEVEIAHAGDTIIGDSDLELLLDRSEEAFAREKGWRGEVGKSQGEKTAFEVFVPAKDEAADGLAHMFGEGEGEE